jgi:hypothetical protein
VPEELVQLCTTGTTAEGELLRSALAANGVDVRVTRADERESLGILAVDRGMKLLVRAEQFERAREVHDDYYAPVEGEEHALDADDGEQPGALAPVFKEYRVAFIVAFGLAWGFLHIYAGRTQTGRLLVTTSLVLLVLLIAGSPLGLLLPYVYFADLIGGIFWIWHYNRRVRQALAASNGEVTGGPYRQDNAVRD